MSELWQLLPIFLVFGSTYATDCTIQVPTDLPQKAPVILIDDSFFRPSSAETVIAQGKSITLLCVGRNNAVLALNQKIVTLTCKSGKFLYAQATVQLRDMGCKMVPNSELRQTSNICAGGAGYFYIIGFTYNNIFLEIITICFSETTQRTIYSRNMINGNAQSARMKHECDPPAFRSSGMAFQPNDYYTRDKQKMCFETIFGTNQKYLKKQTSFLARGHLAPHADFLFCYEQFATYYYANCAPEWQVVNGGNWVRVENAVRKLASTLGSDVLIYTGTLGVLELENHMTGRSSPICLDMANRLVVPKWYYKVVLHPKLDNDIVFVTLNNPFENAGKHLEFCRDICKKYNLDYTAFKDVGRGYTFCCDLKDFWATAMNGVTGAPYYDLPQGWFYK